MRRLTAGTLCRCIKQDGKCHDDWLTRVSHESQHGGECQSSSMHWVADDEMTPSDSTAAAAADGDGDEVDEVDGSAR